MQFFSEMVLLCVHVLHIFSTSYKLKIKNLGKKKIRTETEDD